MVLAPTAGTRGTRGGTGAGRLVVLLPAALAMPAGLDAASRLLGLPGLLVLSPLAPAAGRWCLLLGAASLVAVLASSWRRRRDDAVLVQALGAVLATGASGLWLGGVDVAPLLPWMVGFVVLTIVGKRLELARIAMGPDAGRDLVLLSAAVAATVTGSLLFPVPGGILLGAALLALVGWSGAHDVPRRTVRSPGLPRFMALGMLAGYAWLAVAGGVWLLGGSTSAGPAYDAVVHAAFLGFTTSMVMAHTPMILSPVIRRPLPYSPLLVAPLALLHGSLVLRLWVGDALGHPVAWRVGGLLTVTALLAFVAVAAWTTLRGGARRTA